MKHLLRASLNVRDMRRVWVLRVQSLACSSFCSVTENAYTLSPAELVATDRHAYNHAKLLENENLHDQSRYLTMHRRHACVAELYEDMHVSSPVALGLRSDKKDS